MSAAKIIGNTWYRNIHYTWETASGWRTDISKNVLEKKSVLQVVFTLDDEKDVIVSMADLRNAIQGCTIRKNGMIPFNVNPHNSTINGQKVNIEIKLKTKV